MNDINNVLNIKYDVTKKDIINSRYIIIYCVEFDKTYEDTYIYILRYNKGICTFTKNYLSDNHMDYVSPDALLDDYKQINHIPSLWNEFVECYINAHKQNNRVLPLIKQIYENKPKNITKLENRQEVFSKKEFNQKLKNIEIPKKNGDFYIQPINYNGHFSNIIISNEQGKKKYYLYDSYIGNHRLKKDKLNTEIFEENLNIKIFPIENLQKETNTCGFFCISFVLEAEKYDNINKLKKKH